MRLPLLLWRCGIVLISFAGTRATPPRRLIAQGPNSSNGEELFPLCESRQDRRDLLELGAVLGVRACENFPGPLEFVSELVEVLRNRGSRDAFTVDASIRRRECLQRPR